QNCKRLLSLINIVFYIHQNIKILTPENSRVKINHYRIGTHIYTPVSKSPGDRFEFSFNRRDTEVLNFSARITTTALSTCISSCLIIYGSVPLGQGQPLSL